MLLNQLFESTKPGTYAGVRFTKETVDQLVKLQKDLGVPDPHPSSKFHSTLLYSKKHLPDYKAIGKYNPPPVADDTKVKLEIWPSNSGTKNVLVVKYKCSWLEDRHSELSDEHGAEWDHPDYIPHITLSYNVGDWKPEHYTIELDEPITLESEYQEELDD